MTVDALGPGQVVAEEDGADQRVAEEEHHHPPSLVRVKLLLDHAVIVYICYITIYLLLFNVVLQEGSYCASGAL